MEESPVVPETTENKDVVPSVNGDENNKVTDKVVELTNGIASITADRDSLQAKIDNGEVDAG